jgi:hypothetical protein
MKRKNIARIIIYPIVAVALFVCFWPSIGSTHHLQIKEELKNEILTYYYWELENGARVVRPYSWIEIYQERYTDRRYQPAIHFDPWGEDMRVMTGKNSWIIYKIHLDKLSSGRMNSVFVEESRYPPKENQPTSRATQ